MGLRHRLGGLAALAVILAAASAVAAPSAPADVLVVRGWGSGTVVLDGLWSFHTGDDPAWASPAFADSSWTRIRISEPWGDQGFWDYMGFAWYRRRIDFEKSPADSASVSLYFPPATLVYEVYWNGQLVGRAGQIPGVPADRDWQPETFLLHNPGEGVLAIRTWSASPDSSMAGDNPMFAGAPRAGNPETIALFMDNVTLDALRRNLPLLLESLTYAQLFLLSLWAWWRSRQRLVLWLWIYFFSAFWFTLVSPGLPLPLFPFLVEYTNSTFHSLQDVALWFLLLYLLNLDGIAALRRWTRVLAWIALVSASGDEILFHFHWSAAGVPTFQVLDVVLTAGFSLVGIYPLVLIVLGWKRAPDPARRFFAAAAFVAEMFFVIEHAALQGQRFTHSTLSAAMMRPLFQFAGMAVGPEDVLSLVLVISVVYAVYRYTVESAERQRVMQAELKSAQELQRVLIPEALPTLPGFAVTSAYKPAAEVGGDFFQLIAVDHGAALLVLGDVSGKGLKAAMTVSLLVGALRTAAESTSDPGEILAALNRRLFGRLSHGFVTCLAMRIDSAAVCQIACAGHPAPFLNGREMRLPASLPLGLDAETEYHAVSVGLGVGDRLLVYTDGLLEARNAAGEIFGFDRLEKLAAAAPNASQAVEAAVAFGQEDDIAVLTLTRLAAGVESTTSLHAPDLEAASA